ncbi:hypothetical protein MTR67_044585 [Solanum verrucosum]|uniref:Uncharacterized protein n=1 Tax=Solanum verrucosum TaxID=315347 RepID=A0AAF0ZVS9_SOLVR|nr:hypothetical protein MTR67_044585 [Solanum verrucosum]
MTKVGATVSSNPRIIVTSDDLCNDDIPSDLLFPSGTCINVVLDVRVENTTLNKGDEPNEGKVSNVTLIAPLSRDLLTKVGATVSSIPWIIVTRHDLCNDDIPSDSLLPSRTCIDVVLDVTVDNTTLNKGDVPNEGKVSDVTLTKLQIQRKITHMRLVNLDRLK